MRARSVHHGSRLSTACRRWLSRQIVFSASAALQLDRLARSHSCIAPQSPQSVNSVQASSFRPSQQLVPVVDHQFCPQATCSYWRASACSMGAVQIFSYTSTKPWEEHVRVEYVCLSSDVPRVAPPRPPFVFVFYFERERARLGAKSPVGAGYRINAIAVCSSPSRTDSRVPRRPRVGHRVVIPN